MFTLSIATDNTAFRETPDDAAREVARILRETAERLERGKREGRVSDANGNTVGEFALTLGA
jgi:hypothetical protein